MSQYREPLSVSFVRNFMGNSPRWYKLTIVAFLVINPIVYTLLGGASPHQPELHQGAAEAMIAEAANSASMTDAAHGHGGASLGGTVVGWMIIGQFIFTLSMALKCYPLLPGGLIALEALLMGLTTPQAMYDETALNFSVLILLMFMVAGVHFLKDLLLFIFGKLLTKNIPKILLALMFSLMAAVLSAFLDALTVTAVLIAVGTGFYNVYHKVASSAPTEQIKVDLEQFRSFLRSLMMHGAVGTALGGAATLVGEPQNLLIGQSLGWQFMEFFHFMAPVSMPVLAVGLLCCVLLERFKVFGYGAQLPDSVRKILEDYTSEQDLKRTPREKSALIVQGVMSVGICLALAFHVAEVGIIGLFVIVLLTVFNGITEEHQIGHAFEEALPFVSLLVIFFSIVSMIHHLALFKPVIQVVLALEKDIQAPMFYLANGLLSMISDNVFVATVYIGEVKAAFEANQIDRNQLELLAVAINTGTNIPSVATPNGQAAFLFLLTSGLAPLIRLDYLKMVKMALPYTIVMGTTGLIAVTFFL